MNRSWINRVFTILFGITILFVLKYVQRYTLMQSLNKPGIITNFSEPDHTYLGHLKKIPRPIFKAIRFGEQNNLYRIDWHGQGSYIAAIFDGLSYLDLRLNHLENVDQTARALRDFSELEYLSIHLSAQLTNSDSIDNLFTQIGELRQLKVLHISGFDLHGGEVLQLIGTSRIQTLSIDHSKISQLEWLKNFPHLESLSLDFRFDFEIDFEIEELISESSSYLKNLNHLTSFKIGCHDTASPELLLRSVPYGCDVRFNGISLSSMVLTSP